MAAFTPVTYPRPAIATGAGPDEVKLVANGGYTATASQEFTVVAQADAVEVTIDFTKTGAAPSVVYTLEAFDVAKNGWVTLLTSAAVVATGTVFLLIGPFVPNVTNVSAAHAVRGLMRVTATHGNTDVATYSISAASTDG